MERRKPTIQRTRSLHIEITNGFYQHWLILTDGDNRRIELITEHEKAISVEFFIDNHIEMQIGAMNQFLNIGTLESKIIHYSREVPQSCNGREW